MSLTNGKTIKENEQYSFVLNKEKTVLIFSWKHVKGLSIEVFKRGIAEFASHCKTHKPTCAVIDATELDQGSPAVAWLRGQDTESDKQDYTTWWMQKIVPVYHEAGISSLAVGTGDPNAPGELQEIPPGVNFKMGYFPNLESAVQWKVG